MFKELVKLAIDNVRDNMFSMIIQFIFMTALFAFAMYEVRSVRNEILSKVDNSYKAVSVFAKDQSKAVNTMNSNFVAMTKAMIDVVKSEDNLKNIITTKDAEKFNSWKKRAKEVYKEGD